MLTRLRKSIANFISPQKNSMSLPEQFLRYGSRTVEGDWAQVILRDEDIYTGYAYAAIRNRANSVAATATKELQTHTIKKDFTHPYIDVINNSPTFTNYQFWYNISTYLDLEGIYYLMAIRGKIKDQIGEVKEFKLLNPYTVRRVVNITDDGIEVGGYVQNIQGRQRDIPPHMIIEIRDLNPFDNEKPYSMTDAAKESQFTLKSASDYTRSALQNNINAPGILTTDVVLEPNKFKNFVNRLKNHTKGEPVFGNGAGSIKWTDMNTDLTKAGLKEIDSMNRDVLFSVTGVSKTVMGVEESGTTRDTAKVQKDLYIEGQILPRIQTVIDALNQDYKNKMPTQYKQTEATIIVNNPNATDHESDLKAADVKQKQYDLYVSLVDKGYDPILAAKYVQGEITLDMMGKPKPQKAEPVETVKKEEKLVIDQTNASASRNIVLQQQGGLQNAIVNIEGQITGVVLDRVIKKTQKNQFEKEFTSESDVITQKEKDTFINELEGVLITFYGVVMSLKGGETMRERMLSFSLPGIYKLDNTSKKYIDRISKKVAKSHVNTVAKDLYQTAREAALSGAGQQEIISEITTKYSNKITEDRAKAVARTESNRAFTRAQYEADQQFIKQNDLEKKAYKRWITRSSNPCVFCQQLESEGLIPFNQDFRALGDTVEADGKTLKVNFEGLQSGNAHTNCSCEYELVIQ